jgi:hypothetical protein
MSGITLLFDDTAEAYCDSFNVSTYFNDVLVESNDVVNATPLYEGILTLVTTIDGDHLQQHRAAVSAATPAAVAIWHWLCLWQRRDHGHLV